MNVEDKKLLVERYVKGREDRLVDSYIQDGPAKVKKELGVSDEEWTAIFDYMVFVENLLYKTIITNMEFFLNEYIKFGSVHVREVLEITEPKYDVVWDVLFDFIAISHEGLYYHVLEHRDRYMTAMKARGTDFVRKVLGIGKDKYAENWERVLDFLLHAVCEAIFSEQTFEHSLKAFSRIMNGVREHRPIFKSGIL